MNEEVLEHVYDALQEFEHINVEDVPEHLQDKVVDIHSALMNLSIELDN